MVRARSVLPDMAEHLPAQVLAPCLSVGQQPLAGRDHGHAHAAQHARHTVGPCVDAQAGLRHTLEPGIRTVSCWAEFALRIRVSMSAMGSVMVMAVYQLAFVTPGTSPACTMTRKQMRHSPNLR